MSFEGSEKKVEIIFNNQVTGLREIPEFWETIVKKAKADVLSKISGSKCDAYLLSESSLFVYDNSIVMITCGKTSLIHAVEAMVDAFGIEHVELLVYERKNEVFPASQSSTFEEDIKKLEALMPGKTLYFGDEGGNQIKLFHLEKDFKPVPKDLTLEILMHGLDQQVQNHFYSNGNSVEQLRMNTGMTDVLPGFKTDDFLFEPCGYSINALRDHAYFTSHVTPEPDCSYASFETNCYLKDDVNQLIMKVVDMFKPSQFAVVLFEPTEQAHTLDLGWKSRVEHVVELECGYRFHFYDFCLSKSGV